MTECKDEKVESFKLSKNTVKFCYALLVKDVCLDIVNTNNLQKWKLDLQLPLENVLQWQNRFEKSFRTTLD